MKKFKNDNGKKIIIVMSVLFCTIILIIGTTLAFFTQSDTKEIDNVVTTNINGTLLFDDNNDYMLGNFIPVNEEDVLSFASLTDKCKYQEDMYACNLYQFTITNDSNVAQELIFTLDVKENEFSNLYYNLIEDSIDNITINSNYINSKVLIDGTGEKEMYNGVVLNPKEFKTYTIVYYVKNLSDIDQTGMDAGKQFYANIRVDSITTGTYAGTIMEAEDCYDYDLIEDNDTNREQYGDLLDSLIGTYKLTTFKGIEENGNPKSECGVKKEGLYYSVTVPSKLKDEEGNEINVSTLGNTLFIGLDLSNGSMTHKSYINNIIIDDKIEVIEDGEKIDSYTSIGTFAFMGCDFTSGYVENYVLTIKLPSNLKYLGYGSFGFTPIDSLSIPPKVETINEIFGESEIFLKNLTFEGALEGTSLLTTIGESAFYGSNIESLVIPASVKTIGDKAFSSIELKSLTFVGADNNKSKLEAIGEYAFHGHALETNSENPLILPSSITTIGNEAFTTYSANLEKFKNILFMGTRTNLNKLGTNWYYSSHTTVTPYVEE